MDSSSLIFHAVAGTVLIGSKVWHFSRSRSVLNQRADSHGFEAVRSEYWNLHFPKKPQLAESRAFIGSTCAFCENLRRRISGFESRRSRRSLLALVSAPFRLALLCDAGSGVSQITAQTKRRLLPMLE
ncbi:MAG: hypothetical protein WCS99_15785 [Limisphaerales bacterium]